MSRLIEVGVAAAREAGKVLKQHYGQEKKIEFKGEIDLVTEVDKKSEKIVVEILKGAFPDHSILAEEGSNSHKTSGYKWIIDPLDGTTNYAHDYPFFCVSIGLEKDGEIVGGVVYQPLWDELFVAEKGAGAFLNDQKIRVSKVDHLRRALVTTGFPYDLNKIPPEAFQYFKNFLNTSQAVRRDGSAALDMCYLAMGRLDGFWEESLKPWDTAAGLIIVRESGGMVTNFQSDSYSIYEREILASNGLIHDQMRRNLVRDWENSET
jgi:myo-inositol-1(or 4)-monophosphatase